jgi:hypothetical protein
MSTISAATEPFLAVRIALPASILTKYEAEAAATGRPVESLLTAQLTRFAHLPIGDRVLVLPAPEREVLEQALGKQVPTTTDLLRAVRNLVDVGISGVKITLEPHQLTELKRRADRNGTTHAEELKAAVKQIQMLVFNG